MAEMEINKINDPCDKNDSLNRFKVSELEMNTATIEKRYRGIKMNLL